MQKTSGISTTLLSDPITPNLNKGIHATLVFHEIFFENLLMEAGHPLKNRYLHVEFDSALGGAIRTTHHERTAHHYPEEIGRVYQETSAYR